MLLGRSGLCHVMGAPRMGKKGMESWGGSLMRSGVLVGSVRGVARRQLCVWIWGKRGSLSAGINSGVISI